MGASRGTAFGTRESRLDIAAFAPIYERFFAGRGLLMLEEIKGYHRRYRWS